MAYSAITSRPFSLPPLAALLVCLPGRFVIIKHFETHWTTTLTTWSGFTMAVLLLAVPTVVLTILF